MSRRSSKELAFSDRAIQAAKYLGGRATEYRIKGARGLVLYVYESGRKVFHVHYDIMVDGARRRRKPRIGNYGETSLSSARSKANATLGMVDAGSDPEIEHRAAVAHAERMRFTFADLFADFLEDRRGRGVKSLAELERVVKKDALPILGHLRACDVTDLNVQAVVDQIACRGARALASRALTHLRAVFNYARKNAVWRHRGIVSNPAGDIARPHKPAVRERALTNDEIGLALQGLQGSPMDRLTRIAIVLVLVTGQRPNEVGGMQIDELRIQHQRPQWRLPRHRTKNGRAHIVPLSSLAIRLIQKALEIQAPSPTSSSRRGSPFVFPNRDRPAEASYTKGTLSRALKRTFVAGTIATEPFTPHDLRRTVATGMARLGYDRTLIAKVLNHASEDNRSVTGLVYDQHDYEVEKRTALERWAAHIEKLTGPI